jgi:hypothetical protein
MEKELTKALRDLCDYIGGWDHKGMDPDHPIVKAHKVLALAELQANIDENFALRKQPGGKSA